jgi:hypothetical protein
MTDTDTVSNTQHEASARDATQRLESLGETIIQYLIGFGVTASFLGLHAMIVAPGIVEGYFYTGDARRALLAYVVMAAGSVILYQRLFGFKLVELLRGDK